MKPISVLIPTAHQPRFLEHALKSVARQSAVEQIEEVLVSENLMDRESEVVCKHFNALPIKYILQNPPVSKVQHFNYLYNQAKADFVAILCDDDWWGPGHLQGALSALQGHSEAVAWASACLQTPGDTPWTGNGSWSPILWLAAGRPSVCETWYLASHQMLAAAWIQTPFHISTLVIRRNVLQRVVSSLSGLHSYQDDRMLQVQLGTLGSILYEPLIDTCVRAHAEALTWQYSKAEREREFRECTTKIGDLCENRGVDVARIWKKSLEGLSGPILDDVGRAFRMSLRDQELRDHGFEQFLLPNPVVRLLKRGSRILKNRWGTYKTAAYRSLGLVRRM